MAVPFKPTRPYPLPVGAEIFTKGGRTHARIGREVYPLSKDGTKYLKPATCYYADVRTADGTRKRVRLSPNKAAAQMMLTETLKRIEGEKSGLVDRLTPHRKTPVATHLTDWENSLRASGRGEEYITLKLTRVRAVADGCGWVLTPDMTADALEAFLLKLRTREKRSVQTANDWLQAVRQFVRWLVANDRLDRDPFARLKPGNVKLDQRRRRGEFTPAEVAKILTAAAASPVTFRRVLTGPDRAMIYRVALGTGFRCAELAALVPDHFDLTATPPTVTLPPEASKNRKGAVQPLPADLAAALGEHLKGKPRKDPVWPGTWASRSADMLKVDMTAAGVPVEADGPNGVEVRDFHALRVCFISDVIRGGADLKQAMTLARHSDPRLTTARYGRTRMGDLGALVNKLPTPGSDAAPDAAAPDSGGGLLMTGEETVGGGGEGGVITPSDPEPLELKAAEECRGDLTTTGAERKGFEPLVRCYPYAALAKRCAPDENPTNSGESAHLPFPDAAPDAAGQGITPDLAAVVDGWDHLPEHIRAAVLALVNTTPPAIKFPDVRKKAG